MINDRKKIIVVLLSTVLFFTIIFFIYHYYFQGAQKVGQDNYDLATPFISLQSMFYEPENYNEALRFTENTKPRSDISLLIVPHHLVASKYAAEAFKLASGREIRQVVVIGPNHENIGRTAIATASVNWQTPTGTLETDRELVEKLCADFNLTSAPAAFVNEHSVGALAPFIKYYFPNSQLMPIILDSYTSMKQVEKLSIWLAENLPPESLVVFSLDFSHYLEKEQAASKDGITRQLILERDLAKIMTLNNDYVDSPASLATALSLANFLKLKTEILRNTNSFDLAQKTSETTSHFVVVFIQ